MDLHKAISERRSHRQFKNQKISPEDIREVLESGLPAPSSKNRQPWYFVHCGASDKKLIVDVLKRKTEEIILSPETPADCLSVRGR